MEYSDVINKVAEELNLPAETVSKVYKLYWTFIRNTIKELPIKEVKTEEDFNKLKTNFNIPALGKLYCTYKDLQVVRKKLAKIKEKGYAKD